MTLLVEMTQSCVAENARVSQNQEEFQKRYNGLVERYETIKSHYDELTYSIEQKKASSEKMLQFIKALKDKNELLTEFDEALWCSMVDFITVGRKERTVTFKDGTEIAV